MEWSDWGPQGLVSRVLTAPDGTAWRLTVSRPQGTAPDGGWPVLWVLDAGQHGLTLMETVRRLGRRSDATRVVPMAVIGVSPADGVEDAALRHRVFTPGPAARPEQARGDWAVGGAGDFLDFLVGPCREGLADLGVDAGRSALWGHSLSGLFALWAAAERPDAFVAVAAISPSLWWSEAVRQPAVPAFLAAGSEEGDDRPGDRRMIGRARDLADSLAGSGSAARFVLLEDEDHGSVVSASAAAALRFVSGFV